MISDEVFADYALRRTPAARPAWRGRGRRSPSALGGLSKSCGLPQLKLGWIAVSGPAAARDEALARLEVVADTYLSVGTPVQRARPGLLARLPELQRADRARAWRATSTPAAARRAALPGHAARAGGRLVRGPPRAGHARRRRSASRACSSEDGVLVHPGYFFDFPREAYLVVSLLPPPDDFAEAIDRVLARML